MAISLLKTQTIVINMNQIICLAFPAWEGNYLKSTVQLMKELARNNRVLYVDYAYTWKDLYQSFKGKGFASWTRMLNINPRLRTVTLDNGAEMYLLTLPPIIPTNFIKKPWLYDAVNSFNSTFIEKEIRKAMQLTGFHSPVVINAFNPFFGVHLAGRLNERKLIYYCYDEIGAATWAKQHGERLEKQYMEMVDTVVVTSQGLLEKKSKLHPNCHLIKNGVDYDLFSKHLKGETEPHTTKTIGYLGSIDERVDYRLLEKLIVATPQYQYIFVGRVTKKIYEDRLKFYPNVKLMGSQPPAELPNWVQKFDVCLIPFVKDELTAGIYPLKINEYLAAGKPVVTTRFSDLSDFEDIVDIADTTEAFINMVINASTEKNQAEQRKAFASKNSWRARANQFALTFT